MVELCKQAIAQNPSFAGAYGLALFCFLALLRLRAIPDDACNRSEAAGLAEKCVLVGSNEALPLAAAATFYQTVEHDLDKAFTLAEQAVFLNPNLQPVRSAIAGICNQMGDFEAALGHLEKALRLNPADAQINVVHATMAISCFFLHRFDEARSWASKAVARNPHNAMAWRALAAAQAACRIVDARCDGAHS